MTQGIKDKVIVITGASSGLGEAAARRLARDGAKLVLGARRLERLQVLAKELSLGEAAVQTDVTDHAQVKRLVGHAVQVHGRIDVIINNAGLMPHSPLERGKIDDWNRTIDVNLKGVLYGIAAALPQMKEQRSGHIINVSSVAGHVVRPGSAVYAATKTAVRVISEGLRQEVKLYNIRTTVISPGAVATELPDSITEPDVAKGIRDFYAQYAISAESFASMVAPPVYLHPWAPAPTLSMLRRAFARAGLTAAPAGAPQAGIWGCASRWVARSGREPIDRSKRHNFIGRGLKGQRPTHGERP